jgi:hypothetical protein
MKSAAALVLAALLVAGASPALAQTLEEASLCLVVEAPADTDLANLDELRAGLASGTISVLDSRECGSQVAPSPAPIEPVWVTVDWVVLDIVLDPLTAAEEATAILAAETGTSLLDTPVGLAIRCNDGKTELILTWGEISYFLDEPLVVTRIGDQPAEERHWNPSTSNTNATFYPGDDVAFIKSLFGESKFVARTTPLSQGSITASFDIRGIENAVVNVREACGW